MRLIHRTELKPGENKMDPVTLTVGHTDTMGLEFNDQNGNPMLTQPVPDSPPVWSDAPSPAGDVTFTPVGPSNVTATELGNAAGTDTVTVVVLVGGVSYTATQLVNVQAPPQVLTSVAITNTIA